MKIRTILLSTVCAIAPIGSAAFAQAETDTGAGRDIIVTAQKRSESLEDVPISITALSEERLAATNVTNFTEIDSLSPGMAISQTGPFFLPAIRGVTSQAISGGNENNIATYVDGIYQPNQLGLNFDLASVENIEILKGPQGTLFGRNATGGAILVKTLDPSDKFEGRAKLSYGRFNDWRAQAYVSVPWGETLGFNIAALYRKSDGFLKNVPTSKYPKGFNSASHEELNIRTKLKFDTGEGFSATFALQYVDLTANGSAWQYVDPTPGAELIAATALGGVNAGMTRLRNRTSYDGPNESKSEVVAPSLTMEFELGGLDVKTISSYQHIDQFTNIDIDGSLLPIARQITDHKNTAHSEEINVSSNIGDSVDWVAGLFYFTNRWLTGPNQIFQFGAGGPVQANILKAKSWAAFADATARVTDKLSIIGGMRYSWEKRQQTLSFPYGTAPSFNGGSWDNFSPRIILQYELANRTNIYASFSKGFKSGNVDLNGRTIEPEKIDAFEAGFKTVRGNLRFDAAAYYYDYTNLQDQQVTNANGGLLTVQANVGSAEIYGAEAQVDYTASDNLSLFAGLSWLHAEYKSYPGSAAVIPVAIPSTPFVSWNQLGQDLSGREMPRSPKITFSGGANYTIDAGTTGSFDLAGSVSYKSSHNPNRSTFDPATGAYIYRQKGYALVNASVTWHSSDKMFEVSVYGRNILDQQYNAVYDSFRTFGKYRQFGEPATYGVSVGVNF